MLLFGLFIILLVVFVSALFVVYTLLKSNHRIISTIIDVQTFQLINIEQFLLLEQISMNYLNEVEYTIYKKELFLGANEKQIKSLRKKFRNVTFNFLSTIAKNADKKLIEGFIDFYKQVYVLNDFSFSSIASENTKEEKKEILIKGLEIVKKSMK